MTVRPTIVRKRLAHLARMLGHLERLRAIPAAERNAHETHRLVAERALHVAAEAIFDLGHHILAGRGQPIPASYREVLPALAAAGVVPAALAARLEGLAGLRNILVHDYAEIDHDILWSLIEDRLDDLVAVQRAIAGIPELEDPQPGNA